MIIETLSILYGNVGKFCVPNYLSQRSPTFSNQRRIYSFHHSPIQTVIISSRSGHEHWIICTHGGYRRTSQYRLELLQCHKVEQTGVYRLCTSSQKDVYTQQDSCFTCPQPSPPRRTDFRPELHCSTRNHIHHSEIGAKVPLERPPHGWMLSRLLWSQRTGSPQAQTLTIRELLVEQRSDH